MRHTLRQMQEWYAELLTLAPKEEERAVLLCATLNDVLLAKPRITRWLSDRSVPSGVRWKVLCEVFELEAADPVARCWRCLVEAHAFQAWSRFFAEYLRARERRGFKRLLSLATTVPMEKGEQTALQTWTEKRLATPVLFHHVVQSELGGGFHLTSTDGWVLDASLVGRLDRLATALAM